MSYFNSSKLEAAKIPFALGRYRGETVLVTLTVVGARRGGRVSGWSLRALGDFDAESGWAWQGCSS
jgi:hypothetical protein